MSLLRRTNRDDRHTKPAFSLIELFVVLFILAILGAIAMPRFSQFSAHQKAEAAARRIAADINYARRQAHATGTKQSITFDLATHSYSLGQAAHPDHPDKTYAVELRGDPYHAGIVSASFGGDAALMFDAFGAPDSGGTVTIAVGAYQKTVSVTVRNGQASVD